MIVIPTYNEKNNIVPLLKSIRRSVPQEAILFVDDNSPDGTADEIRHAILSDTNITLQVRPKKLGLGTAYRDVFKKAAAEGKPDYVITMDADLSHPPAKLPEIIALLKDYPVVIGSRYATGGGTRNWGLHRRIMSRIANLYAGFACGIPVSDLTSGFVGYRTEILQKLPLETLHSDGYSFLIEMKYLVFKVRAMMKEVPIVFVERREGKSKLSPAVAWEAVRFTTQTLLNRWL